MAHHEDERFSVSDGALLGARWRSGPPSLARKRG